VTLAWIDERLAGRVPRLLAAVCLDVCQLARDEVHEDGSGVAVPGELRTGLNRVPHDHGARRVVDLDDRCLALILLESELHVDVVGEDRPQRTARRSARGAG